MTYEEKKAWLWRYRDACKKAGYLRGALDEAQHDTGRTTQQLSGMPAGGGDGQALPRSVERIEDAQAALDDQLHLCDLLKCELLAKLLPELDGNSGSSGIPAQEVRIMADITAAAAAPHTARKIGIFSFIWMHFLLHKFPLVKRLCCLVSVYSFRHGFVNEEKQQWGILFSPPKKISFPVTALQNPPGTLDKGRRSL